MNLSEAIDGYVSRRRIEGASYVNGECVLRSLCRTLGDVPLQTMTADAVVGFINHPRKAAITRRGHFSLVNRFPAVLGVSRCHAGSHLAAAREEQAVFRASHLLSCSGPYSCGCDCQEPARFTVSRFKDSTHFHPYPVCNGSPGQRGLATDTFCFRCQAPSHLLFWRPSHATTVCPCLLRFMGGVVYFCQKSAAARWIRRPNLSDSIRPTHQAGLSQCMLPPPPANRWSHSP